MKDRIGMPILFSALILLILAANIHPVSGQISVKLSSRSGVMRPGILVYTELAKITITVPLHFADQWGTSVFVMLSCSGQPNGVDVKFEPNPLVISGYGGEFSTTMNAKTAYDTKEGVYDLTITMYNPDIPTLSHQEHYQLTISAFIPGFDPISILIGFTIGTIFLLIIHRRLK